MKWTQVDSGSVYAAGHQFLTALGDNADVVIARVNSDSDFVGRLAKFAISGGFQPTTNQKRARKIMGNGFFGIEEATKHFGVNPTQQQFVALSEITISEAVLEQSKDTCVLIAVFPLSILEIRGKVERNLFYSHEDAWYNEQSFAKEIGVVNWQLVYKTPVKNSFSKSWQEQQALLGKEDETPNAQAMVYTIIGHYLATGERLFNRIYVRTSSFSSDGDRICVGFFDSGVLGVNDCWDGHRRGDLGLASARKVQSS